MIRDGIPVEIHWAMANCCATGGDERTWKRAEPVEWMGVEVLLPSLQDEVVFTLVHICRHHFIRSHKWFGDLVLELEKQPDLVPGLGVVAEDWPHRIIEAPLRVACDWGLPTEMLEWIPRAKAEVLDWAVFKSLISAAVFDDPWIRMPQYRFSRQLYDWLSSSGGSLPWDLLQGINSRAWHN
jgi:hypothetical protein